MDNKNISTIGIDEGIDYLSKEFIGKLDENVNEILDTYTNVVEQGTLSSANIDSLVGGIKTKIGELQNNFDELSAKIKTNMMQSSETIAIDRTNIENTLNQS